MELKFFWCLNLSSCFKLTTRKIFDYKKIFFLFKVAKSISFKIISTSAAKLMIFLPLYDFLP